MIYLRLIYNFLIVGLFSFGGAYSVIPLMQDVAIKFGISSEQITDFISVAESTPGPIAVNLATFIGNEVAGIVGAVIATFTEVLPAYFIIVLYVLFIKSKMKNTVFGGVMTYIKPCIIALIISSGLIILVNSLISIKMDTGMVKHELFVNKKAVIIFFIITAVCIVYKKMMKKELSTLKVILFSAGLGIIGHFLY